MKIDRFLFVILCLSILFRFFRLLDFQYWSVDEEIFVAVVRQVAVNHKLILTSPNVAIVVSLGSFFHLFSAPIFVISDFIASRILIAGSILGVITTFVVYKTGKEIGGQFVARVSAFLYASSFLVSFSDRRWWPLTPDPLLATLSVFAMAKIIKVNYLYSLLLVFCGSFAWHSDPSLFVIVVFTLLSIVFYRLPIFKKAYLPAICWMIISVLPFLVFELRHPGSITHPFIELFTRSRENIVRSIDLLEVLRGFTRGLFLSSGVDIEKYFLYTKNYAAPLFSPFSEILTVLFFVFPILFKDSKSKIIYLFIVSFLIGVAVFTLGMGSEFHQHYFVVVWPAFFILIAISLQKLRKPVVFIFLGLFLLVNLYVLFFSSMRYPLYKKEVIVNKTISYMNDKPFALNVIPDGRYFEGIGALFFLRNKFPSNLNYYYAWDWIYRAYSLYEINPTNERLGNVVVVSPK